MHWMKYLDRSSPGNFQPATSPPDRSCSGRHSCIPFPCFWSLHHRSHCSWSTGTRQTRLRTMLNKFAISNISTWAGISQAVLQLNSVSSRAGLASVTWPCASTTTAPASRCHFLTQPLSYQVKLVSLVIRIQRACCDTSEKQKVADDLL